MNDEWQIGAPATPAEFREILEQRYEVLRRPIHEPRGTEQDELDEPGSDADHVTVRDAAGELLGSARLQMNSPEEAQIRYMAVAQEWQGKGVGRVAVLRCEEHARQRGAVRVVLNSRIAAVEFYERLGYRVTAEGPHYFHGIQHKRMEKEL